MKATLKPMATFEQANSPRQSRYPLVVTFIYLLLAIWAACFGARRSEVA